MHLGQDIAICGFLPQQRALLLSRAILAEQGSKNPREQTEPGMRRDASPPLCLRSGSRLNSPFRLQSLHAIKKGEGYILLPAGIIQTSLKSLADASPTSFQPWSVQDCEPGSPRMPPSTAKAAPNKPNALGQSPLLLRSDSPSLCNRLSLLVSPPGGLAGKISSKGQKEEPD